MFKTSFYCNTFVINIALIKTSTFHNLQTVKVKLFEIAIFSICEFHWYNKHCITMMNILTKVFCPYSWTLWIFVYPYISLYKLSSYVLWKGGRPNFPQFEVGNFMGWRMLFCLAQSFSKTNLLWAVKDFMSSLNPGLTSALTANVFLATVYSWLKENRDS